MLGCTFFLSLTCILFFGVHPTYIYTYIRFIRIIGASLVLTLRARDHRAVLRYPCDTIPSDGQTPRAYCIAFFELFFRYSGMGR